MAAQTTGTGTTAVGTSKGGVNYVRPGRVAVNARSMRLTGPQQFDTEIFSPAGVVNVQKNIPLQAPLATLHIRLRGRLTVTANITDAPPEAPANLFSLIKIFGTHTTLGSQVPFQLSGEMAQALPLVLGNSNGAMTFLKINNVYYSLDQIASGVITPAFFTAAGSPYDFEVQYVLPTYPFGTKDYNAIQYLWDARSWGQTLQIQFTCRDASATGAFGTTGTKALSSYGSATGNPSIDILLDYAYLGPSLDASIAKAVVTRNSQFISQYLTVAGGANTSLLLLQNQKTTCVLVKTGTLETGSNNVYATLLDSILEQTVLLKNSTPIRNLQFNSVTEALNLFRHQHRHFPGYLLLDAFSGQPSTNPHAAIRANEWSQATQFRLASQIVGPAAANIGEALQEYIQGEPTIAASVATSASTASGQ